MVIRYESTAISGVNGFRERIATTTETTKPIAYHPATITAYRITPFGFMNDVIDIPNNGQSILYQRVSWTFSNIQTIHLIFINKIVVTSITKDLVESLGKIVLPIYIFVLRPSIMGIYIPRRLLFRENDIVMSFYTDSVEVILIHDSRIQI